MKERRGYIMLARKILDSEIMDSPPHIREVWLYLILEANHSTGKLDKVGIHLERGQCWVSNEEIRKALSWNVGYREESYTIQQIKQSIRTLKNRGMITTQRTIRKMVITVCNYDFYQTSEHYENNNENNKQGLTKTTTNATRWNKKKKKKNINRDSLKIYSKLNDFIDKLANSQNREIDVYDCSYIEYMKTYPGVEHLEFNKLKELHLEFSEDILNGEEAY